MNCSVLKASVNNREEPLISPMKHNKRMAICTAKTKAYPKVPGLATSNENRK
jgi:hypothetical protein